MIGSGFSEFAIIFFIASTLGIIANKLRQPAILGYIAGGLIVGPLTPFFNPDLESINLFSKIGLTLLLFILGLELNFNELRKVGKVAIITGIGQILFTSFFVLILSLLLGFSFLNSFYLAIGLTFSSTIIIVKLFSQTNQIDTLHGRISMGFLLVQDIVAIAMLISISTFSNLNSIGNNSINISNISFELLLSIVKALFFISGSFFVARNLVYPVLNSFKAEKEIVFITVISWALVLATISSSPFFNFSIEVGGLVAGMSLASRVESLQIESWTRPLRDFFIILFFVVLGLNVHVDSLNNIILSTLILSAFVLIGKPLIVIVLMKFLGYSKKTSFFTSLAVAQISEFSLLVANFGFTLGHVSSETLTTLTLVGGITMTISTYFIYYNEKIFESISKFLSFMQFVKEVDDIEEELLKKEIVVLGCNRFGKSIINLVPKIKSKAVFIDLDPSVIKWLHNKGYSAYYGDISDIETLNKLKVYDAKIVISTVPNLKDNLKLINFLDENKSKAIKTLICNSAKDLEILYSSGADFVFYPQLYGTEIIKKILKKYKIPVSLVKTKNKQLEIISELY